MQNTERTPQPAALTAEQQQKPERSNRLVRLMHAADLQDLHSKNRIPCCLILVSSSESSHHEPKFEDREVKSAGWKDKKGYANRRRCGEDRSRRPLASWYVTSKSMPAFSLFRPDVSPVQLEPWNCFWATCVRAPQQWQSGLMQGQRLQVICKYECRT